jgi:outer membrane protein assembly factor BamB
MMKSTVSRLLTVALIFLRNVSIALAMTVALATLAPASAQTPPVRPADQSNSPRAEADASQVYLPIIESARTPATTPTPGPTATSTPRPSGTPVIPPGDKTWPMLAANPERTSWTPEEVRGNLSVEWYLPFEPYIPYKIQPIAANGRIYVSTARGLYSIDATDGNVDWVYGTEMPLGHSPTIATVNGRSVAYVGGYDRKIHALDAITGNPVSGYTPFIAGAGFETNPLVVDNVIYAGNRDGFFYALDAITGEFKWRYETGDSIQYSAAYKNGTIYFASNDTHAYALNAADGSLVWKSAKLPGSGFRSYWPVMYTDPSTGEDYVIFSGGENYRFRVMNLVIEESDTIYDGLGNAELVGPASTSIPGNWVDGTVAIDAQRLTDYFENRPDRRTVFVLERATGNEFTFDSDGDGKPEYAPFNWSGVTHSGNRHPPIVNAVDGVYYQTTGYIAPGWISRGGPVGWKFGTQYISRVDGDPNGFASDEPVAYSSGGKLIYYVLCCDRVAGAMDVTIPFGQPNRGWGYYGYNLANNILIPGYQQMYDAGNQDAYNNLDGWQIFSGKDQSKNGVYGKHGGTQSPPIPYLDKVYLLKGNALIAFSPTGTSPKTPLPLATIAAAQTTAAPLTPADLARRLENEIQKILAAGPLRPGYHDAGLYDQYGSGAYTDERSLGEIFDYFQNPADTVYTLLLAYPHLSSTTQQQVKTYLQNHYGPGQTYDFTKIVHIGWGSGAAREHLTIPQEVIDQWGKPYRSPSDPSTTPICGWCGYWKSFPPFSFYAAWQYAKIVGNSDPAFAKGLFDQLSNKLEAPLSDDTFAKKPYWLNLYIAGYKGYLELQKLAGYPVSQDTQDVHQRLLDLRVSSFAKDTPYLPKGAPASHLWGNNALAVARNFMFLTPELGDYLNQHLYEQVQVAVNEYTYVAPYWFVANFDSSYGEATSHHLYDTPALFQAKAYILRQPHTELAKWLDAPAFSRGDLFYIQNLAAILDLAR